MAKNYILEPTEMTFEEGLYLDENVPFDAEAIAAIPSSAVVQIGDTILKYAYHSDAKIEFTENGQDDRETYVGKFFNVKYYSSTNKTGYGYGEITLNDGPNPIEGTYTVSIYTETPDEDDGKFTPEKAGLPDMNVNFTYNGEYQSAIKRIATYLTGDAAEDPGYSSMEIIAKKLLARVEGGSTEVFSSPMDAIAWAVENGAIDAPTEG